MEIKICKTCGKQFLSENNCSYCRICSKKWHEEREKIREQVKNLKWQEQRKREQELFESEVQAYKPILMENITPSAYTLYLIGNGFDLMHRVPSCLLYTSPFSIPGTLECTGIMIIMAGITGSRILTGMVSRCFVHPGMQ